MTSRNSTSRGRPRRPGFGISGAQSVSELIERGTDPGRIVVLDPSAERLEEAEAMGCNVLEGDASRDETLMAVRIAEEHVLRLEALVNDTLQAHADPEQRLHALIRGFGQEYAQAQNAHRGAGGDAGRVELDPLAALLLRQQVTAARCGPGAGSSSG